MIQKQELISLLLQNQPTFIQSREDSIKYEYERDKNELMQELLGSWNKAMSQKDANKKKVRIVSTNLHINQTPKVINLNSLPSEKTQSHLKEVSQVIQKAPKQYKQYIEQQKLSSSKRSYYNQYISQNNHKQLNKRQQFLYETYTIDSEHTGVSILDSFLVRPQKVNQMLICDQKEECLEVSHKHENKFYNESTLEVSKFKKGASPHRSLRVTERGSKSKSKSSDTSHKFSPFKMLVSKDLQPQTQKSQKGVIVHNGRLPNVSSTNRTPQSQKKHNLSYSKSSPFEAEQDLQQPSEVKPFTTSKIHDTFRFDLQKEKEPEPAASKLKSTILQSKKKKDLLSQIKSQLANQKLTEQSKVETFNYDKENNIFDNCETEKHPLQRETYDFSDFKKLLNIKDAEKFNKEVEKVSKQYKNKNLQQNIKASSKQVQLMKPSSIESQEDQLSPITDLNKSKRQQQASEKKNDEESFHFFNFLKDKLLKLNDKEKLDLDSSENQEDNSPKEKRTRRQKTNAKQSDDKAKQEQGMKGLQSQDSSSSFIREKREISKKGVKNINLGDLVGQTVKRVAVNLDKIPKKNNQKSESNKNESQRSQMKRPRQSHYSHLFDFNHQKSQASVSNQKKIDKNTSRDQSSRQKDKPRKVSSQSSAKQQSLNFVKQVSSHNESKIKNESKQLSSEKQKSSKKAKSDQVNLSSDFFAASRPSGNSSNQDYSHPSTVQKIDSHSDDKSDILKHLNFQDNRDNDLIKNLFDKPEQQQKSLVQSQGHQQIKENSSSKNHKSQKSLVEDKSSIASQKHDTSIMNNKPKTVNIDLQYLKEVSLSKDAISFSKLESVSQSEQVPQLLKPNNKNKNTGLNLKKLDLPQPTETQKSREEVKQEPKKGKVKRIQINLEESSSQEEALPDSSSESGEYLNMDQLQDYQSDESIEQKPVKVSNKSKEKTVLPPVMEEDMEQSQFPKAQANNPNIITGAQRAKSSSSQKRQASLKMLEQQFLKDFPMQKNQSEVESYQKPSSSFNKTLPVNEKIEKRKISIKPTESKFTNSEVHDKDISLPQLKEEDDNSNQKELLESIKGDVQKLKHKIESSVILDSSKIEQKSLSKHSNVKRISVELKSDLSNADKKPSSSNSMFKVFNDSSSLGVKDNANNNNKSGYSSSGIFNRSKEFDFDQINGDNHFQDFRDGLKTLRTKIRNDVLN